MNSNEVTKRNLTAAYNTLIERRDMCLATPSEISLAWAEAYHESASIVAAAMECSGIKVLPKSTPAPAPVAQPMDDLFQPEASNAYQQHIYQMEEGA